MGGKGYDTYLTETPKHLIATAASKKTANEGYVKFATAKNEDCLGGHWEAHRLRNHNPSAVTPPENTHVRIPGMRPDEAIAYRNVM